MRMFAVVLSLVLCWTCSVSAKTIFVNNIAGSNTNTGELPTNQGGHSGPLRTINAALRMAKRGTQIDVANTGVPYRECLTLQGPHNSGFEFAPFVISGNGATLDGSAPVPANQWRHVEGDVHLFTPERLGYQILLLDGQPLTQLPRSSSSLPSSYLQPQSWCVSQNGILFRTEKGKSPYVQKLTYGKHRVGISLYNVEHVVLQNLTVQGYQLDGINAHDNAHDCVLSNIVARANGRSGIAVNGASRIKVVECKGRHNAEAQLRCSDWSTTSSIQSDFRSKSKPAWTRHVNAHGQGARLLLEGTMQLELEGWNREDDPEPIVQPDSETPEPVEALKRPEDSGPSVPSEAPPNAQPAADDAEPLDESQNEEEEDDPFGEGEFDDLDLNVEEMEDDDPFAEEI